MQETSLDQAYLATWVGRSEEAIDVLSARQARLMQTTLDRPADLVAGDPLPPLWHWIYFPVEVLLSGLGRDGHPRLGGFLPPVALPRRMWAGGRFEFLSPLCLEETVKRRSTIARVALKEGRSGKLCFVTVAHSYSVAGEERLREEHDIVYREDPDPGAPSPAPPQAPKDSAWSESVAPSAVQLFRYSALTFNGHRIHYDRDYCRDVEGYPGLVFHGPLTATLLAALAERETAGRLVAFAFTATAPLFDDAPFTLAGKADGAGAKLWAERSDGAQAMSATARFQP
ncbi:MAG: MaoC family dehydratase N-terminal domain-containing protein [Rhodospirillales bacterium]